jgi:catechol 2,3-dioxygenase-like lactoylglutathione lyase family enzyme
MEPRVDSRWSGRVELDHIILPVNDRDSSVEFYTDVLGLEHVGERDPFSVIRVTPAFTLQLAPWGTSGGYHLAFAMAKGEFDAVFARIRDRGILFGDSFHAVGNMRGPGNEEGSRGPGATVYLNDPNDHLVEIRCYD